MFKVFAIYPSALQALQIKLRTFGSSAEPHEKMDVSIVEGLKVNALL